MDDAPDYSKYSPRELRDVAARVDRAKFPERHALVSREIERRKSAGDDAATATRSKPVTVWNLVSVLFAAAGGALLGAILQPTLRLKFCEKSCILRRRSCVVRRAP